MINQEVLAFYAVNFLITAIFLLFLLDHNFLLFARGRLGHSLFLSFFFLLFLTQPSVVINDLLKYPSELRNLQVRNKVLLWIVEDTLPSSDAVGLSDVLTVGQQQDVKQVLAVVFEAVEPYASKFLEVLSSLIFVLLVTKA